LTGSWDEGLRQDLQESRGLENLGNRRRGQDCRSQSQWMRRRGARWRRRRSARHRAASQSRRVMAERGSAETGRWTSDAETTERQIGDGETTGGGGGFEVAAPRQREGGATVVARSFTRESRRGRDGEAAPGPSWWERAAPGKTRGSGSGMPRRGLPNGGEI